jgi:hypothetical protein
MDKVRHFDSYKIVLSISLSLVFFSFRPFLNYRTMDNEHGKAVGSATGLVWSLICKRSIEKSVYQPVKTGL